MTINQGGYGAGTVPKNMDEPHLLRPIDRRTITDEVLVRLSTLIREGVWKPGDRLPAERELADRLGVGRGAVREALKSLEFMGYIRAQAGDGTYVAEDNGPVVDRAIFWAMSMNRRTVADLFDARQVIEPHLALLAAQHATEQDLEQLRTYIVRMREVISEPGEFLKADVAFHTTIARVAGNEVLYRMILTVAELLTGGIARALSIPGTAELALTGHSAVLAALERRDSIAASEAMKHHLDEMELNLTGEPEKST